MKSIVRIVERVKASSALINVMGFLNDEEVLAAAQRKVFLDIDPGFGQMWQVLGLHVLEEWPSMSPSDGMNGAVTTVATWRGPFAATAVSAISPAAGRWSRRTPVSAIFCRPAKAS